MLQVLAIMLCVFAAEDNVRKVPHLKEETSLVRLKTVPEAYVGKDIYICGMVKSSDYYNYYYRETQKLFFCLRFYEIGKDSKTYTGEQATLYLPKRSGSPIMSRIVNIQEKAANDGLDPLVLVFVKAFIRREAYENDRQWDMLEVQDVRFINSDFADYGPWVLDSLARPWILKGASSGGGPSRRTAQTKPKEPLPLRTWTDNTGEHKTTARFASLAMGNVTLELENGETVTVPLERLSEEDQDYIRQRR